MPKLKDKRILLEWNGEIFWDNTIDFKINNLIPMSDKDGVYLVSGIKKYELMFPVAKKGKHNHKRATYIEEFNRETNLNHRYKVIRLCKIYDAHRKKIIHNGVTLILFHCTVDERLEYEDCVCSNWNFDPIWGYSGEIANVAL